jgi:AcrR family transcriptional regulator
MNSTLGTLALRADVSRPVVYDHFSTRAGLLLALFQRLEDNDVKQLRQELSFMPGELAAVADGHCRSLFPLPVEDGPGRACHLCGTPGQP